MEALRKQLRYTATREPGKKLFPSYDNDTFVSDSDVVCTKGDLTVLDNVRVENDRYYGVAVEDTIQECEWTSGIINVSEAPSIVRESEDINGDVEYCNGREMSPSTTISIVGTHKELAQDRNQDSFAPGRKTGATYPAYKTNNALKPHVVTSVMRKRSPPLGVKAESFDCNKYPSKCSVSQERGVKKPQKTRSISDTRNPLMFHRLNMMMRQFEEALTDKHRKKDKHNIDPSTLSPIYAYEKSRGSEIVNEPISESESVSVNSDDDKSKGNKRWLRKLARYATFDEGSVYLAKTSKSTQNLLWDGNVEQLKRTDENIIENDNSEQCTKGNYVQRKISAGKMFRISMSQGISKFKQLSMPGRGNSSGGGGKIEHDYSIIDNDIDSHETSKRLEPLDASDMLPSCFSVKSSDDASPMSLRDRSVRRSFSVPDYLDSISVCDEELSDLYLPRRAAICPDLAVPAMEQLKTYLVLTSLKQYCIM